ncbi:MAG: fused MFS/spermidine synthase [Burkholderiaceae bacterium]|uniref:fused MFS/spermidine synthase n=1 Tax=Hydrogenophaga sp. TaxID=1904254 RepID=UPI00275509BF|nr:fused MFS/spermidine synthase [Hydrogenophaga sp.]MDP2064460.1 fused MFS/spermidine synthase [Burkholderiaceae bacterium]MDZ4146310.1 fused MFS/spermidine synthase [Burkholderiales bacterium]MDZ4397781.1 fused MFS/spermidine synthase [Hydrogenophaga sp.]
MDNDFLPFVDRANVRPVARQEGRSLLLRFDMDTVQSSMNLDDPCVLELEYTRAMMLFLLFRPAPRHILMVGLGGGSLARYCHRHLPETEMTVVEINPHVIGLRDDFLVPPDGPRFRVVQADGAAFVRVTPLQFDVILVDGFHFDGQPDALGTLDFYSACRTRLAQCGVAVVNMDSDAEICEPLLGRLKLAFDGGVTSILPEGGSNRVAFAALAPVLRSVLRTCHDRLQTLDAVHRQTLGRRSGEGLAWPPLDPP